VKISNLILVVALIIIAVLLIGRFNFSEADFSMYNPAWNGMTQFSANGSLKQLNKVSDISGVGENTVVMFVSPTINFTEEEVNQVSAFLRRGGKVIVMDDFGTANSLLINLSSPVTLYQLPLCDDESYYRQYSFPVITDIKHSALTDNVSELVLNHPATLNTTGNTTILASTTELSWLDIDANLWINGAELYGKFPVIASAQYGQGELIVVSDPDVIVNVMLDKGNNSVFASNILKSGTVYMDISHGQKIPPMSTAIYVIKYDLVAQLLCSLLILLIGIIVHRRKDLSRSIFGADKQQEPLDRKRSIIDFMKAKLPVKESDIKELNKKL